MDYAMHGMPCGGGWMYMGFGWILIIVAIVFTFSWIARRSSSSLQAKTALDILKERYARGEVSKAEFEDMKKDLS